MTIDNVFSFRLTWLAFSVFRHARLSLPLHRQARHPDPPVSLIGNSPCVSDTGIDLAELHEIVFNEL